MTNPEALPVGHITISYALGDDGHPNITTETKGELPLVTALGMLRMAEDTILSPEWDDSEDDQ